MQAAVTDEKDVIIANHLCGTKSLLGPTSLLGPHFSQVFYCGIMEEDMAALACMKLTSYLNKISIFESRVGIFVET